MQVFTCPPYWNLEKYSKDPADLSNMTVEQFEVVYEAVLSESVKLLKENGFFGVVIGEACHDH